MIDLNYAELLVMHRTLMDARYSGGSTDPVIKTSPILSDVHFKVIQEMIRIMDAEWPGRGSIWTRWLDDQETKNTFYPGAFKNLLETWTTNTSTEDKMISVAYQLAPFSYTDAEAIEFVSRLDAAVFGQSAAPQDTIRESE